MPPAAKVVRFDGSACLNVRSIETACNLFTAPSAVHQPISLSELGNALWFVETCVTAKGLFVDGTVPRQTFQGALDALARVKEQYDLPALDVRAIAFGRSDDVLRAATQAMTESRLLIERFAFDPALDRPVPGEEHRRFVGELDAARRLDAPGRWQRALELVSDPFRGSKALAALLTLDAPGIAIARRLYGLHPGDGERVTGAIINRFRLNYLNELASSKQSAYVPNPNFEQVTKEHVRLFKDFLLERLVRDLQSAPDAPNLLVENLRSETPLPPIGLYALMATREERRPGAVLETALRGFRENVALMKHIWECTLGGMKIKSTADRERVQAQIDAEFYKHYKTLEKEAAGIKVLSARAGRSRTYVVPALLKAGAGLVPKALGLGGLADAVYQIVRDTASDASVGFLSGRLLGAGCDSYISEYQSFKWDLAQDDAVKQPLARLAQQVERVFGRPLA